MQLQLIMSMQKTAGTPNHGIKDTKVPMTWEERPYGSVWAFDGEAHNDTVQFVSSTFSQALHSGLYLWSVRETLTAEAVETGAVMPILTAIDDTEEHQHYWRMWTEAMRH